jgi:hypothetical protein
MTDRVYVVPVSAAAQFVAALLLLAFGVLCVLDGLTLDRPMTGLLVAVVGIALLGMGVGAFINGCRIVAARFQIMFGWRN